MRSLLSTAATLTMLCGAAFAQTSTSGSTSGANVNTSSGSRSNSISSPSVNVYGNPIGNGASSSNSSATGRSNSNSRSGSAASSGQSSSTSGVTVNNKTTTSTSTGTDPATSSAAATNGANGTAVAGTNFTSTQTLRNTPEIIAPSIVGGDPCTVGASGGVTLPGFGIVTGGSWEGKACERRQLAALLFNMGHGTSGAKGDTLQEAAVEVLCVEAGVREALKRIGQPLRSRHHLRPKVRSRSSAPIGVTRRPRKSGVRTRFVVSSRQAREMKVAVRVECLRSGKAGADGLGDGCFPMVSAKPVRSFRQPDRHPRGRGR